LLQKSQKVLTLIAVLAVAVAAALFLLLQAQFAAHAQTNHSPVFSSTETGVRRIAENTAPGTDIGDPFTATDEDGHTLTYLILDKLNADSFDIDSTTGQLRTKAPLDYETKRSYSIVIAVHDSGQDHEADDHTIDAAMSVIVLVTNIVEEGEDETEPTSLCTSQGAVPDGADNPDLVLDCEALYTAKDTLTRTVQLNWALDTPISDWEGITIGGSPQRVTGLSLPHKVLRGTIPPIIQLLTGLEVLDLKNNDLTGQIPSGLGRLDNLDELYLSGNRLTGCIPLGLDDVGLNDLSFLDLPECQSEEPPIIPPVVIVSPVPTAAPPSPTPTSTATPHPDDCIRQVEGAGTFTGNWNSECLSENRPQDQSDGGLDGSDYYSRYFAFTLGDTSTITISLASDQDTFLYLMEDIGRAGEQIDENDDIAQGSNLNSRIGPRQLASGDYTIEATTYYPDRSGSFTLTVEIGSTIEPPAPTPTPSPTPTPQAVYTEISSGANHVCALRGNGSIMCWGNEDGDSHGQVSDRPATGVFTSLSSGDNHTCALRNDGVVICWGSITVP